MLNKAIIMGRLTADPEKRMTTNNTPVTSFTVAVDRDFSGKDKEKETDFINCVAWRSTADFVSNYFSKGSMIVVSGRLQVRKWQNKDGENRYATEVVADNVYFGESKRTNAENTPVYPTASPTATPTADFPEITDIDSFLPF